MNLPLKRNREPMSLPALRRLLAWYRTHKRALPWRETGDPYAIWVSEVMLQQTQVATVKPYFRRWMRRFPTIAALANASLDEVLKVWEGCGYYARARNLHRAAIQVVNENGGSLPQRAKDLERLPGIGRYTAAAIASIVSGEAVPVLDGNVQRVLSRLLLERRVLQSATAQKRLRKAAESIMALLSLRKDSPGELNQALMELGALICTPKRPQCLVCPLKSRCLAYHQLADPSKLPHRKKSRALPHHNITAAVIQRKGKVLITQRPHRGLLGGLWEFPGGKQEKGESLEECITREIREELGIEIAVSDLFAKVNHSYSHFRITLYAFLCTHSRGRVRKLDVADFRWVAPLELQNFAFPKADRMIIQKLLEKESRP